MPPIIKHKVVTANGPKVTSYILRTLINMGTWQPEETHVRRTHENVYTYLEFQASCGKDYRIALMCKQVSALGNKIVDSLRGVKIDQQSPSLLRK